jgi:hypothetical protein
MSRWPGSRVSTASRPAFMAATGLLPLGDPQQIPAIRSDDTPRRARLQRVGGRLRTDGPVLLRSASASIAFTASVGVRRQRLGEIDGVLRFDRLPPGFGREQQVRRRNAGIDATLEVDRAFQDSGHSHVYARHAGQPGSAYAGSCRSSTDDRATPRRHVSSIPAASNIGPPPQSPLLNDTPRRARLQGGRNRTEGDADTARAAERAVRDKRAAWERGAVPHPGLASQYRGKGKPDWMALSSPPNRAYVG